MKKKKLKILILQCFDFPNGQSNRSHIYADELQKKNHEITYLTNKYNHLDFKKKINCLKILNIFLLIIIKKVKF